MPFIKKEPFKPEKICQHLEHNPPQNMYLEPGHYTYKCPSCGKEVSFTVPLIMC
jgi:hypothetical protein